MAGCLDAASSQLRDPALGVRLSIRNCILSHNFQMMLYQLAKY